MIHSLVEVTRADNVLGSLGHEPRGTFCFLTQKVTHWTPGRPVVSTQADYKFLKEKPQELLSSRSSGQGDQDSAQPPVASGLELFFNFTES